MLEKPETSKGSTQVRKATPIIRATLQNQEAIQTMATEKPTKQSVNGFRTFHDPQYCGDARIREYKNGIQRDYPCVGFNGRYLTNISVTDSSTGEVLFSGDGVLSIATLATDKAAYEYRFYITNFNGASEHFNTAEHTLEFDSYE